MKRGAVRKLSGQRQ